MANSVNLNKQKHGLVLQTEALSAAGTYAAPTKQLAETDSGKTFIIDMSANNIVVHLPAMSTAGIHFKFVQAVASNNVGTFDCAITTGVTSTNMVGNIFIDGAHLLVGGSNEFLTSQILWDSSAGAVTAGDWMDFTSDGSRWYVRGSVDTASAIVVHDSFDGTTLYTA